jgi:hypothetical protein
MRRRLRNGASPFHLLELIGSTEASLRRPASADAAPFQTRVPLDEITVGET